MANDIKDIKTDLKAIKDDVADSNSKLTSFLATAPLKFTDKKDFDEFRSSVYVKIAFVSGIFSALMFMIDKFYK